MTTAATSLLGLALPVTGELSGTWGDTVNNSITSLLDTAVAGTTTLSTDGDVTLSTTTLAANQARQAIILWTANGTTTRNITAPAQSKIYTVINASAGTQSIVLRGAGPTTGVTIIKGESAVCAWNGSDFIKISNTGGSASFTNVTVSGTTTLSGLTASTALALNSSKEVVSVTNTGTGNNVLSASPTLTGTISAAALTLSSDLTLSGGTANGVLYLNGSKVATSGSALTFDGTTLTVGTAASVQINSANYVGAPSFGVRYNASNARLGINIGNSNGFPYIGYNTNNKNGSDTPTYDLTQAATQFRMDNGQFIWNRADSGTAGTDITWSEAMRLTSTGLGIGTSSPGNKLVLNGAGAISAQITSTDSGGSNLILTASGTAGEVNMANGLPLLFKTSNTERMRLDSSGNLGLGVTPSAWGSAYKSLEVNGAVIQASSSNKSQAGFGNNYYHNGTNYIYSTSNYATSYFQNSGAHTWYTAASGTAGDAITFTQAMTLDASGNLIIGDTSSSSGISLVRGGSATAELKLSQTGSGGHDWRIGSTGSGYGSAGNLIFYDVTAGAERARIDSSGNLMAGRTSALAGARISAETSTGSPTFASYGPTTGTEYAFDFVNPNGIVGSITTNGSATAFNTSSDYRLKDNPQPLNGSGAFIDALKPKTWNWKADGSVGVGFIAHEVQEVSPGSVVGEKDGEQMQAMEYGSAEFIANIIAELQSLRARVAALES